ncbi:MAG: hypothetical protein HYV29_14400 [Ignavibacteriales bacterium]|nr:hypothetical protein [Ignavibacteriales bacterium]
MGQQQQLLIVLGLLIVGVSVATGIRVYQENMDALYLSQIEQDLIYVATKAQEFYHKPAHLEGGEGSFSTIKGSNALFKYLELSSVYTTAKKAYTATFKINKAGRDQILDIQADGIVMLRNKKYPRYTVTVTGKSYKLKRIQ